MDVELTPESLMLAASVAGHKWSPHARNICYGMSAALRRFLRTRGELTADTFYVGTLAGGRELSGLHDVIRHGVQRRISTPHCVCIWNPGIRGQLYLLDATLDQVKGFAPLAAPVSWDWFYGKRGKESVLIEQPAGVVRYTSSQWQAPRRFDPSLVRMIEEEVPR